MTPKLLFLDLDGTVIWPGTFEMPESTEEALRLARENGLYHAFHTLQLI